MKFSVLLSILCITSINAGRVLVAVPSASISHQVVFYPLVKELLKRGHEVVFMTTDPMYPKDKAPANLTEIDNHDMSYKLWRDLISSTDSSVITGSKSDMYGQLHQMFELQRHIFEKQIQNPEFQDLIKRKVKFDLLIIEAVVKSAQFLTHVFKAPAILMSSFGSFHDHYELLGAPRHPRLLYPYCLHQKITNMSVLDKIKVLWDIHQLDVMFGNLRVKENAMGKRLFGPDTPKLEELGDDINMMFLNVYPIWEMNRPVPPGVVFIGGIHQKTPEELPADFKKYLDSSKRGVVYFSLGTNVSPSTLPAKGIKAITEGLAKLPYDVLVKWNDDSLPGQGNNTKVVKWLPQADLLRHPNIKAFVTQGGLQSFDEALTGAVPLVGIPMLGDQWYNVEMYVYLKIGVGLILEDMTADDLLNAVNTVINDPSYRRNMIELRKRIRDQPETALQRAIWWSEHLMRHGDATHIRAPAANMSWAQYIDIPLMTTIAFLGLTAISVPVVMLYLLGRYVRRILNASTKSKKE